MFTMAERDAAWWKAKMQEEARCSCRKSGGPMRLSVVVGLRLDREMQSCELQYALLNAAVNRDEKKSDNLRIFD